MEFFVPEAMMSEIPWNFSCRSLRRPKFHGIFFAGVSGAKNSVEFLFREIPAPKPGLYDKINELSNKKSFAGVIFFSYIKHSTLIFSYLIIILLKKRRYKYTYLIFLEQEKIAGGCIPTCRFVIASIHFVPQLRAK
jgi:hypothetical protein